MLPSILVKQLKKGYIDDIHSMKALMDLWEKPPSELIVPLRSDFKRRKS